MHNKLRDNNSPLKDLCGSIEKKDLMKTICITKQHFQTLEDSNIKQDKKKNKRKPSKLHSLSEQYGMIDQIKR